MGVPFDYKGRAFRAARQLAAIPNACNNLKQQTNYKVQPTLYNFLIQHIQTT